MQQQQDEQQRKIEKLETELEDAIQLVMDANTHSQNMTRELYKLLDALDLYCDPDIINPLNNPFEFDSPRYNAAQFLNSQINQTRWIKEKNKVEAHHFDSDDIPF